MSDSTKPPDFRDKETAPIPLMSSTRPPGSTSPPSSADPTSRIAQKRRSAPPPPKHEPGARVDRYIIEKLLGRGGMAEVYQAHDPKLKRKVALKVLHGDQKFYSQKRLLFEAQAAANFQHPNSVIIYDVGEAGEDTFIAMELIQGRRLSEFIRDTTVPLGRKVRWIVSIARALAAAHRKGLVHRDIKPANVMIRDEDSDAKVLDFGIARQVFPEGELEGDITEEGQMVGTIRYAAPEQITGEQVDSRADQFSWGITAFQLLSGRLPFIEQDTMAVATKVVLETMPSLGEVAPDLPNELIAVIDKAVSRDPNDRFDSMDDVADALECYADGVPSLQRQSTLPNAPAVTSQIPQPSAATHPTPGSQTPPLASASTGSAGRTLISATQPSPRRKWLFMAAGAAAVAGILGIATLLQPKPQAAAPQGPARAGIPGLRCAPATFTGDADPAMARAIGTAACARLGIEVGVPWGEVNESFPAVNTKVTFGPEVEIALEVQGERAAARGSTPIQALTQAVTALAVTIPPPPLGEREVKAWGAKDEVAARRIERAFRRRSLWVASDGSAEAKALLETDADSPVPHLLVLMSAMAGKETAEASARTAESLAGNLPPARAKAVRAVALALPEERDRAEASRLLDIAYSEAPSDTDIAALFASFAIRWGLPQGFGALDRLLATTPARSFLPLESALTRAPRRDLDKIDQYAAKLVELFPEARATPPVIRALVTRGKLEEARQALAFGKKLGLDRPPADRLVYADSVLLVELASGNAAEARALAFEMLGDPAPLWRVVGNHGAASSLLLEGKAGQAEAVLWDSAERYRTTGDARAAMTFAVRALGVRRLLKQPPVGASRLDWIRKMLDDEGALPRALRAEGLVELALTQRGLETFRVHTETLKKVEAIADKLPADAVMRRHEILVKTIPLVRALQGDRLAIERWHATDQAPFSARLRPAFDAALAMDATGDMKGALEAYELAADAWNLREGMLERVLAIYRMSKLLPRMQRFPEAAARKKEFDGMWKGAENSARNALELIK